MDPSPAITTLLDRKAYYLLFPMFPGGLLLFCILAGKPGLRSVVMNSEGFGYIFRISVLVATAWVLGGVVFLVSFVVAAAVSGLAGRKAEKGADKPWNMALWKRIVVNAFGPGLVEDKNTTEWKQLYLALDKAFPDDTELEGPMLAALLLSSGIAISLGTIWWRNARQPILYIVVIIVLMLGSFFAFIDGQTSSEELAARQIGILLRHKLEVEKTKDPYPTAK